MKRSTYKLLKLLPASEMILRHFGREEIMLCSPLLEELMNQGIVANDIFTLLEDKYPGEVVTSERFFEGYAEILSTMYKEDL